MVQYDNGNNENKEDKCVINDEIKFFYEFIEFSKL